MKNYFLKSSLMKYLIAINISLLIFGSLMFCIGLILSILIVYSYRKIRLNNFSNNDIELSSIFSPISGKVQSIETLNDCKIINIKTNLFGPLGCYMPFSGTVDQVDSLHLHIFNKLGQSLSLDFDEGIFRDSKTWLKAGDLAKYSANIGFLGLCGGIKIRTDKKIKVLVEKGQKVFAGQSVIAGFEVTDER